MNPLGQEGVGAIPPLDERQEPIPSAPRAGTGAWMALIAAFLGWMFDGLEMGIFPIAAPSAVESLTGDRTQIPFWFGVFTCLFLIGAALGGLVFGWLGDRIGRVRAMSLSILTYSLFTGACYFATEGWHIAALRFIAALGMGGEWSLGVALVMECWPAAARPMLAGAIGAASNVGFLLVAVLARMFPVTPDSWRWTMLLGAVPALLTFFIRLFVPESERWRAAVAEEPSGSLLGEIFGPKLRTTTILAITFGSIALLGTWGSVQWIPTWVEKQLTLGADVTFGATAKAEAGIASSLGAIVGCFVGALLGGALGRRPVYFGLCLASLVGCWYLFRFHQSYDQSVLVMVFFVGLTTAAFYGWLPLYLPELFPTRVRATGQGLAFNFGRIFAAVGVLGTGQLVEAFDGDYARAGATISLIYAVGLVVIWLAPETKGRPLPD